MPATKIGKMETHEESKMKFNNQTILKKQHKKAKPTYNLKTPLRRQERGKLQMVVPFPN